MLEIEFALAQPDPAVDVQRLRAAIEGVLRSEGVTSGSVSVALVSDAAIQAMNRQYLNHDCPTDVLSFTLERQAQRLEGQLVVSIQTAAAAAARFGWSASDELLLYVIHGALHLAGYEDEDDESRKRMRQRESQCLAEFGLAPHWTEAPGDEAL